MCGKKFGDRDMPYKSAVMAHWIYRNRAWVLIRVRYPVEVFVLKEWQPLSVALESDVVHYVFRLGLIYRDKKWWKVSEKFDTLRISKWMDDMEDIRSKYCPRTNAPLSGTPTNLNNAQA